MLIDPQPSMHVIKMMSAVWITEIYCMQVLCVPPAYPPVHPARPRCSSRELKGEILPLKESFTLLSCPSPVSSRCLLRLCTCASKHFPWSLLPLVCLLIKLMLKFVSVIHINVHIPAWPQSLLCPSHPLPSPTHRQRSILQPDTVPLFLCLTSLFNVLWMVSTCGAE